MTNNHSFECIQQLTPTACCCAEFQTFTMPWMKKCLLISALKALGPALETNSSVTICGSKIIVMALTYDRPGSSAFESLILPNLLCKSYLDPPLFALAISFLSIILHPDTPPGFLNHSCFYPTHLFVFLTRASIIIQGSSFLPALTFTLKGTFKS